MRVAGRSIFAQSVGAVSSGSGSAGRGNRAAVTRGAGGIDERRITCVLSFECPLVGSIATAIVVGDVLDQRKLGGRVVISNAAGYVLAQAESSRVTDILVSAVVGTGPGAGRVAGECVFADGVGCSGRRISERVCVGSVAVG